MLELAQCHYHLPSDTVTKIVGSPIKLAEVPPDLRRGLAGRHAPVRPARRVERLHLTQALQLHLPYISLPAEINLGDASMSRRSTMAASITITTAGKTSTSTARRW